VLATKEIADKVQYGEYGATFGAGPVAMAHEGDARVVEGCCPNVVEVGRYLAKRCEHTPGVQEVRGLGSSSASRSAARLPRCRRALIEQGFITGTADEPGVLRLLPPLTLTHTQVDSFVQAWEAVLKSVPAPAGAR